MSARNKNAARKIEEACRRGWTPQSTVGPATFIRRRKRRANRRRGGK